MKTHYNVSGHFNKMHKFRKCQNAQRIQQAVEETLKEPCLRFRGILPTKHTNNTEPLPTNQSIIHTLNPMEPNSQQAPSMEMPQEENTQDTQLKEEYVVEQPEPSQQGAMIWGQKLICRKTSMFS